MNDRASLRAPNCVFGYVTQSKYMEEEVEGPDRYSCLQMLFYSH